MPNVNNVVSFSNLNLDLHNIPSHIKIYICAYTAQKRWNTSKPWRNSWIYRLFVFMQTLWEKIKHKGHFEKPWNDSRRRKNIFLQESFSCEFCDKRFRQLSNKKKDELLHTGEKPYSCQFCDKKFRVQSIYESS